jgi:DNA-binding transcriptional LysR family regulator
VDLNRIATFVRVVEAGSFTAAAAALGLPKSSVSRNVARLEDDLGVRLLQRTTRKLQLTEAGRLYFEHVNAALGGLDEASRAVTELSREPHGTVRVTAPPDLATSYLADVFARFQRRHPRIRVDLNLSSRVVDLVGEGYDLAIRAGRLTDSSLVGRKIGDSELGLFASPDYLARRGTPVHPADLAAHDCVIYRVGGAPGPWRLTGPDDEQIVAVSGPFVSDDIGFLRHVVATGLGIGLLPTFRLPEPNAAHDALVRVLPDYAVRGSALHVLWPSARYVPVRVALLRDFLVAELAAALAACTAHHASAAVGG